MTYVHVNPLRMKAERALKIWTVAPAKKGDKARTIPLGGQLLFERNRENMGKLEREDHAWPLKLKETSACSTS